MSKEFDPEKTFLGSTSEAHHVHESHDDEHEEHIDERWLVSYADMMTLLFGLFVLLYSLATMDKNAAEKVIQSTQEKFGEAPKETAVPPKVDPQLLIRTLQEEKAELEKMLRLQSEKQEQAQIEANDKIMKSKKELEALVSMNKSLQNNSQDVEKWVKKFKELEQKISQDSSKKRIAQLEAKLAEQTSAQSINESLKEKIEKITLENTNLKQTLSQNKREISSVDKNLERLNRLESEIQKLETTNKKLEIGNERLVTSNKQLETNNEQLVASNKQFETSIEQLEKNNQLLQSNLKKAEGSGGAQKAFLAVFISWSTRDHDIDLVVRDPSGKKFDFKNRKHGSHPGYFALDTRRGPGAELWQTDRIIPGLYSATYSFYNEYGNTEAAKVSGTIYSAKGSFEITAVQMNVGAKKEYLIQFDVKEDGSVNVLNMKH